MDTPRLSLAAQREEYAKLGRKLVERAEAQLDKSAQLDKGRRVVTDKFQSSLGIDIRT